MQIWATGWFVRAFRERRERFMDSPLYFEGVVAVDGLVYWFNEIGSGAWETASAQRASAT